MERRKFLQLIGVGIVATAARLTTGGGGGNEEQPALPEPEKPQGGYLVPDKFKEVHKMNGVPATIEFTQTPEDPDSWHRLEGIEENTAMYTLGRSVHYSWDDDQELWKLKRRQTIFQGPVPPGFVILEPSEQMVKELEALKAKSITILARYT